MESDITVLRGLSKRINALLVFDKLCVDQLHSISQTLTSQVESGANVTLLEIITRDVYKLLLLAKEHEHDSTESRIKLVEVVRRCIEKLRVISTQVEVDSSMVFSHIKSCCEKDLKVKTHLLREIFPLMLSFGSTEVDGGVSEEALISLNHILIGVSRGERLALSDSCKPELVHLANYLLHCGDYSLQEVIMETFTRMAPQTSRKSGCSVWFENFPPEAQEAFLGFGKIAFQLELKPFLNAINGKWKTGVRTLICEKVMLGDLEMYNPESQHLPNFYVDFSMGSKIITFFGVPNKGPWDNDTNPLIFVKILREDIKSSVLIATQKPNYHELTLNMMIPVCFLANTKYRSETEIVMLLNVEDIEILKNVIGDKFNINTSKASSRLVENDSKQELVVIKSSNKRVTQEPGFYMFRNPEDNVSVVDSAPTDIIEPEYLSLSDETNAKKREHLATPMNLEPVRVDRSPGKSTYADYLTVADSDEDLGEPDIKGRKATPAAKSKNVMPIKATPAEILVTRKGTPAPVMAGGKLLSRNLTPGAVKSKESPSPNQTSSSLDEELEDSKTDEINNSKKSQDAAPVSTNAREKGAVNPKGKIATKGVKDHTEPLAKKARGRPRKSTVVIQPRVQRPRRAVNLQNPPRKSTIETSPETASEEGDKAKSLPRPASQKKRKLYNRANDEDLETQLTIMITDDVFIDKSAKGQKKNSLPHDDFAKVYKSKQQLATLERQRKADSESVSESSNNSSFEDAKPRQKLVKKKALPEVSRKSDQANTSKQSVLQNDELDSSQISMRKMGPKAQVENKLNLEMKKISKAKNTIKKRAIKDDEDSDWSPSKKIPKTTRTATKNRKDDAKKMLSDIDQLKAKSVKQFTSNMSDSSDLLQMCSVDKEFKNLKEEFLKKPADNTEKQSKLKLMRSRLQLKKEEVKNLLESSSSSDEEIKIIGTVNKPKKVVANSDSPPYFFEDIFCNSGEENLDKASPPPKKNLKSKKKICETSDEEELESEAQPKPKGAPKQDDATKADLRIQQEETKLKPTTELEVARIKLKFREAILPKPQVEETEAELVGLEREKVGVKLLRAQEEANPEALANSLKFKEMMKIRLEKVKTGNALQEEAKLKPEKKDGAKRIPNIEVVGLKTKPKQNCSSGEESEKVEVFEKKTLSLFHKLAELKKKYTKSPEDKSGCENECSSPGKSTLMLESPVKNIKQVESKDGLEAEKYAERMRLKLKPPQPNTSEDATSEVEVEKEEENAFPIEASSSQQRSSTDTGVSMDHNEKLLMKLTQLHQLFNQHENKTKNSLRLDLALEMKKELQIALKKEKEHLDNLSNHLHLIREIINLLQSEFDLSGLKNNTNILSELAEQLVKVTDAFFDPIDLETMSKQALHDRQKALYNDVHASVCSVLDMFKLI